MLIFTSTNVCTLSQLNALASVRRLDNLTISVEGNPVTKLSVWRAYVVFRLAHFSLKHINVSEVSSSSSRRRMSTKSQIAHLHMHHLVFGINFQIHSISLTILVSFYLFIHFSTHLCHHLHSRHPSLLHSFTPGSKPTFSINPSHSRFLSFTCWTASL